MAIQTVNIGAIVNDGTGDPLRTAYSKLNDNFTDTANAASKLVQTSPTDTTAGAIMAVGAFGLGADGITATGSLNNIVGQGFYGVIYASVSDLPSDYPTTGRGALNVFRRNDASITQELYDARTPAKWVRSYYTTWSAWQRTDPQAFGLGDGVADAAIYTGDLLALSYTERVRVSNTATNKPVVSDGYARNIRRSSTYKTIEFISDDNITYNNTLKNGVWSGWDVVYTGANLNLNVFGGNGVSDDIAVGFAEGATTAVFFLPVSGLSPATSITVSGTFNVVKINTAPVASGVTPTLNTRTSDKITKLSVSGLSGLTLGEPLTLRTDLAANKITVNF